MAGNDPILNVVEGNGVDQITADWSLVGSGFDWVKVWRNVDGGSFSNIKTYTYDREAYDDNDVSQNVEYGYKIEVSPVVSPGDGFSDTKYIQMFADTTDETIELDEATVDQTWTGDVGTDTIELDESASGTGEIVDSTTDGITLLDSSGDIFTLTLETNYGYYFGDFSGKIYHESEEYGSDAGTAINAYWLSKETDFADIDGDALGRFKTVYKARLFYVDKTAGQSVAVSISTDGGTTWTDSGRNVGTGDDTVKSADFFFIKTGDVFQFKVNHDADSGKFQWINLEVFYSIGGDYFEVA